MARLIDVKKYSLINWTGIAYKISRMEIKENKGIDDGIADK